MNDDYSDKSESSQNSLNSLNIETQDNHSTPETVIEKEKRYSFLYNNENNFINLPTNPQIFKDKQLDLLDKIDTKLKQHDNSHNISVAILEENINENLKLNDKYHFEIHEEDDKKKYEEYEEDEEDDKKENQNDKNV